MIMIDHSTTDLDSVLYCISVTTLQYISDIIITNVVIMIVISLRLQKSNLTWRGIVFGAVPIALASPRRRRSVPIS